LRPEATLKPKRFEFTLETVITDVSAAAATRLHNDYVTLTGTSPGYPPSH